MRIQHNIMAMNAYRNYNNNTSALSKNLEKLSSGYKINRAGDDAAGLAISEKMRAQITGLETAQKNAKDGISLIQTAEGALTEVHDMLNRMVELATQSANGTYDNDVDRKNLQAELDQLRTEIDRIADSANFNGIKLFNGSMAATANAVTLQIGDTADSFNQLTFTLQTMKVSDLGIGASVVSISTATYAASAVDFIKTAINKVSTVRGQLGAYQNRLDHTINNLSVMTENIQDAESTIRDTDVADEMMAYTKNNILIQSAQAMLAQANQVPQGVLQLLQ
ncbi:flagellin [Intestinimonas butyriciproducens]|uniref:flagellin N-terminal helical domain-containing protein n=1 Tax=Intestinimonas butyriciproducens TaxID=1297617 RepID=UPI00195D72B3|nr:flagellin [Intestinimonas butyriciproducens]MBM6974940.1 flagellin [Intestinimonas butyriciproducens]